MPPEDEQENPQVIAARKALERFIRGTGWKLQEIDAKLGYTRGWVSRVLHGDIRLTYEYILDILGVIGVAPHLFFLTLHPSTVPRRRPVTPVGGDFVAETRALAERLLSMLPPEAAAQPELRVESDDELEARLSEAVRLVLADYRRPPSSPAGE
jgi:hypothetical protein